MHNVDTCVYIETGVSDASLEFNVIRDGYYLSGMALQLFPFNLMS